MQVGTPRLRPPDTCSHTRWVLRRGLLRHHLFPSTISAPLLMWWSLLASPSPIPAFQTSVPSSKPNPVVPFPGGLSQCPPAVGPLCILQQQPLLSISEWWAYSVSPLFLKQALLCPEPGSGRLWLLGAPRTTSIVTAFSPVLCALQIHSLSA